MIFLGKIEKERRKIKKKTKSKMKVLIFDTETTGLPKTRELTEPTLSLWPYIVQLSYLIYDTDQHILIKIKDHIIQLPENVPISVESIQLHGITQEISQKKGVPWERIIDKVSKDFESVDLIVAHNLHFDLNMLEVELKRHLLKYQTPMNRMNTRASIQRMYVFTSFLQFLKTNIQYFCTMQESVDLCNIKKTNSMGEYIKYPKLSELHQTLFQQEATHLHNSLNDILICLRCFCQLRFQYDICDKNEVIKKKLLSLIVG
jgi:hypothetical protein